LVMMQLASLQLAVWQSAELRLVLGEVGARRCSCSAMLHLLLLHLAVLHLAAERDLAVLRLAVVATKPQQSHRPPSPQQQSTSAASSSSCLMPPLQQHPCLKFAKSFTAHAGAVKALCVDNSGDACVSIGDNALLIFFTTLPPLMRSP
jgi:hypothetical protein